MSPVLEERMLAAIGDAKTCPHGHPIVEGAREEGVLLADVEPGASVHVLRFENEAEEILHYLRDAGLAPGARGQARELRTTTRSSSPPATARHTVSRSVAETVSVRADPAPAAARAAPRAARASAATATAASARLMSTLGLSQPAGGRLASYGALAAQIV